MYKHLVMWKVKEEVDGMNRKELIDEVVRQLKTLPAIIPEIVEYEVGTNIGAYGASFFDVSIISSFKNEEDFKKYCVYSEHDAVVAYITSVVDAEEIVDYEV